MFKEGLEFVLFWLCFLCVCACVKILQKAESNLDYVLTFWLSTCTAELKGGGFLKT